MKKMKKVLALVMAMAMVFGMAISASAANTASIKIKGLMVNDNTQIKVYPVVVWDESTNAWDVSDWVSEGNITLTTYPTSANWDGLKEDATKNGTSAVPVYNDTVNTAEVTISGLNIGMYLIIASGDTTTYEVMGVQTYTYETNDKLIGPLNKEVYAKGQKYPINKTFTTEDQELIAGYGEEISYNINAIFPSFGENQADKTFWIQDNPNGLSIQGIVVKVNDATLTEGIDYTLGKTVPADKNDAVRITFTEAFIGNSNEHATQPVVVTVTAKVEEVSGYLNYASSNKGDNSTTITRKPGSMTLTKKNEDSSQILTGAQFEIYDEEDEKLAFIATGMPDEYRPFINGDDESAKVTLLTVGDGTVNPDTKGVIKIVGLGDGKYTIKEVKAPNGYAVADPIEKTIVFVAEPTGNETDNAIDIVFDVPNSRLASLPSTGGIGTTIFTVGGCIIMIAAAALFFMNRRKSEE